EKLAERFGRDGEQLTGLRQVGCRIDLDGANEERKPRQQQQAQERFLAEHRPDAAARDDDPRLAARRAAAGVAAVALVADAGGGRRRGGRRRLRAAHDSPTACANTSSRVGTLGRRCRTCTRSAAASANRSCAPPSPGTKTRITSSSVA